MRTDRKMGAKMEVGLPGGLDSFVIRCLAPWMSGGPGRHRRIVSPSRRGRSVGCVVRRDSLPYPHYSLSSQITCLSIPVTYFIQDTWQPFVTLHWSHRERAGKTVVIFIFTIVLALRKVFKSTNLWVDHEGFSNLILFTTPASLCQRALMCSLKSWGKIVIVYFKSCASLDCHIEIRFSIILGSCPIMPKRPKWSHLTSFIVATSRFLFSSLLSGYLIYVLELKIKWLIMNKDTNFSRWTGIIVFPLSYSITSLFSFAKSSSFAPNNAPLQNKLTSFS